MTDDTRTAYYKLADDRNKARCVYEISIATIGVLAASGQHGGEAAGRWGEQATAAIAEIARIDHQMDMLKNPLPAKLPPGLKTTEEIMVDLTSRMVLAMEAMLARMPAPPATPTEEPHG